MSATKHNNYTDFDWENEPSNERGTRNVHQELVHIKSQLDWLPHYGNPKGAASVFREIRLAAQRAERALKIRAEEGPRVRE